MNGKHEWVLLLLGLVAAVAVLAGCEDDARVARVAMEASREQAEQNRQFAQLARATTESHQTMVASVEESRQQLVSLQQELRDQADRIDAERRALADERRRESLLAPVLARFGVLVVAAMPLVLAWYLLAGLRAGEPDAGAVGELLIEDLVSEEPRLLPGPEAARALPFSDADEDESAAS